jgi:hypothetical protein
LRHRDILTILVQLWKIKFTPKFFTFGKIQRHLINAPGLVVGQFEFSQYFSTTAQGLKPNVTYFATKSTGRAFDLYELRAASFWFVLENRTSPSCLLI